MPTSAATNAQQRPAALLELWPQAAYTRREGAAMPERDNHMKELLDVLACPRCGAGLRLAERAASEHALSAARPAATEQGLACDACALVFPIVNGIPVMLLQEALPLQKWEEGAARLA